MTIHQDMAIWEMLRQGLHQLAWLAEQGLVENDDMGGLVVATLTQRGADVAQGRVTVPGVKRPTPRR